MRILVAPDKFKGSLGAAEAAENIAAGLRDALPAAEITLLAIADGGEGTAEVICSARGGEWQSCHVQDANGGRVVARYCTIDGGETAVIESSESVGLWRISTEQRDPMRASSFGVGELLLDATRGGARKVIVGLGGSATNDGGFGMARALGFRFLDQDGNGLGGPVSDLERLARIETPKALHLPEIIAAADVRNPLLGRNGATHVFGKQKGATAMQRDLLEHALARLAEVVASDSQINFRETTGAGAAGGLGYGLMTFASGAMRSGFEVVSECIGLEAAVRSADLVVTGEGRLDAQTLEGKAPGGVARLARRFGKKIYAIVGQLEDSAGLRQLFDAILPLRNSRISLEEAMAEAPRLLRKRAREIGRALQIVTRYDDG